MGRRRPRFAKFIYLWTVEKKQSIKRYFTIGAIFLTIVNLLIYNDVASFWPVENQLLIHVAADEEQSTDIAPLPAPIIEMLQGSFPLHALILRLPAGLAVLLTLGGLYFLGRKIFGEPAARMATLVSATSFLLLFLGKLAGVDAWLVAAQIFQMLGLIYYLKKPKLEWSVRSTIPFFLGCYLAPVPMFLWAGTLFICLGLGHKGGKHLLKPVFFGPLLVAIAITLFSGGLNWETPGLLLGWSETGVGRYLLYNLFALLPWLAFLPAALIDSFKKIRKKEELSTIYVSVLLAALVSGTAALQVILALMIGRHILFYFQKGYPYQTMVRALVVLHFILAFFGLFAFIMLAGYVHFGGAGYRAAITVAVAYWGGSLVSVTGIFSDNRSRVVGSLGVAAMIGFLMFWLNAFPLVESRRGWEKIMIDKAMPYRSPETKNILLIKNDVSNFGEKPSIYAKNNEVELKTISVNKINQINKNLDDLVLMPKMNFLKAADEPLILRDSVMIHEGIFDQGERYYIGKWR